ncbi:GtrA family protein [Pseudomonas monsensis]|uniref:GtrA family protein n=1 Tax=Pseudomonas monsensis TaxID=2745509 RepID=A0ABT3YW39_9PSED|nr:MULTISPECIES: GtrA family protein [Pseudomonas]MCY0109712.1 GtrA family protein [Pseudomonas monsensis]MDZ3828721.1 GtrA family protein [Pseudomonas monsensis]
MNTLKNNPQVRRWISFLIGGGLNTGLTYCLYLLLSYLIDYQIAYAIAYVAGIVFAYFFNSKVVFKVEHSLLGMLIYPTIYLVQYIFGALLLNLLVEHLHLHKAIAPILVILLLLPSSYLLNKIVLKATHKTKPAKD